MGTISATLSCPESVSPDSLIDRFSSNLYCHHRPRKEPYSTIIDCINRIQCRVLSATIALHPSSAENTRHKEHISGQQTMLSDLSDGELIRKYLGDKNESAFETLLDRYYDRVYKRFLSHCRNPADAADLSQQLWLKVLNSLDGYQDDGKFPSFLMRIATNLLTDYWRRKGVRDDVIADLIDNNDDEAGDVISQARDHRADTQASLEHDEAIEHLVSRLIPSLGCEQRTAFLLRHESEYWEGMNRLSWDHLAKLNGIEAEDAWTRFERTRNTLLHSANGGGKPETLECEDLLIFLVWTQAQRLHKQGSFTWDYFAEILHVPVATMKTRYRSAVNTIRKGMNEWSGRK